MRYLYCLLGCFLACSSPPASDSNTFHSSPEAQRVIGSLETFFKAASDYNYITMQQVCMRDFHFSEDGESWSLDELITFMDYDKGRVKIQYHLSPKDLNVKTALAWVHFDNKAIMTEGAIKSEIIWHQTAALKKTADGWLIIRIEGERINKEARDSLE